MTVLGITSPSRALIVSEIMYNPADETLEFIELYNNRAVFEDLSGYVFTKGIEFTFDPGTILGAKEYLVVALDPNVLGAAFEIPRIHGPYSGKLSNSGERIELTSEVGEIVISFRYNDAYPWSVVPDGTGHSLIRHQLSGDPQEAATWCASAFIGGSPGVTDVVQVESEDPTQISLIEVGHRGHYFKGTYEPSPGPGAQATTDWTHLNFDDNPATTDWIAGASGYGYSGDAAELVPVRTVLNDMRGNYISVYARLRFNLTADEIGRFSQLIAEVYYDDDFVLYLNGARVGDSGHLPGTPPAFDQGRGSGSDYGPVNVDLSGYTHLLVPGTNVLAAQA
ncbi:MAG: lamin tail domain-containing protein, partial [Planctomycetes bacterium]|nr:lamin tail domain-containing protein [Planctomycetota bacterium]